MEKIEKVELNNPNELFFETNGLAEDHSSILHKS